MPTKLSAVQTGQRARITRVTGTDRFVARVTSIGLTQGCRLQVVQNVKRRPVLVYARDSSIAIDRDDCEHIEVEVETSAKTEARMEP